MCTGASKALPKPTNADKSIASGQQSLAVHGGPSAPVNRMEYTICRRWRVMAKAAVFPPAVWVPTGAIVPQSAHATRAGLVDGGVCPDSRVPFTKQWRITAKTVRKRSSGQPSQMPCSRIQNA